MADGPLRRATAGGAERGFQPREKLADRSAQSCGRRGCAAAGENSSTAWRRSHPEKLTLSKPAFLSSSSRFVNDRAAAPSQALVRHRQSEASAAPAGSRKAAERWRVRPVSSSPVSQNRSPAAARKDDNRRNSLGGGSPQPVSRRIRSQLSGGDGVSPGGAQRTSSSRMAHRLPFSSSSSSSHLTSSTSSSSASSSSLHTTPPGRLRVPLPLRGHRLYMEGIAEMLLALERIEHDEELTFEQLMTLEANLLLAGVSFRDQHRGMRLDIDDMSYEELLALEEEMGSVSTALPEEALTRCLRRSVYGRPSRVDRSGGEVKCSVCQEEYEEGEEIGRLHCGHVYHVGCIQQWLRLKKWCPICKSEACPS